MAITPGLVEFIADVNSSDLLLSDVTFGRRKSGRVYCSRVTSSCLYDLMVMDRCSVGQDLPDVMVLTCLPQLHARSWENLKGFNLETTSVPGHGELDNHFEKLTPGVSHGTDFVGGKVHTRPNTPHAELSLAIIDYPHQRH